MRNLNSLPLNLAKLTVKVDTEKVKKVKECTRNLIKKTVINLKLKHMSKSDDAKKEKHHNKFFNRRNNRVMSPIPSSKYKQRLLSPNDERQV